MNQTLIRCVLALVLSNDILCQYITIRRFDGPKIWYDKNHKRMSAPKGFEVDIEEVGTRGIVADIKGFLKSGRCLLICIWNNLRNCVGLTSCSWKCIVGTDTPPPNAMELQKQNDDDIVNNDYIRPDPTVQENDGLSPDDIVNFFVQTVNCIGKYLPYNKDGLKRFVVCIINKAFCNRKPKDN